ncbi:hypothetical protein LD39_06355 [Halobacillus sp. BBL2006]|nr:hypothetical protein LD39_06355 [Halobacillus sp. BBL2006]
MQIRKACFDDARGIAEVSVSAWQSTYKGIVADDFLDSLSVQKRTEKWADKINGKDEIIYIAEKEGKIVGYASGGGERGGSSQFDGELYAIYLLKVAQKKGIGKLILFYLLNDMEKRGYRSLLVWILKDNRSKGFYEKLGAKRVLEDAIVLSGVSYQLLGYGWQSLNELRDKCTK